MKYLIQYYHYYFGQMETKTWELSLAGNGVCERGKGHSMMHMLDAQKSICVELMN